MTAADVGVGRRRATALEWLALGVAVLPLVVAVGRAAAQGWMPVGDAAYFTVRSRDVLTSHHPLLGAWSSGSSVVGTPVNNLGPMQLDILAPFTKLAPDLGTAVGSALINAASVVAVWLAARRLFRPAAVVLVMAATTLFEATLGLSWLIDARQQNALVLPLFALMWLSAAMWAGVTLAVPLAVGFASLTVQTHFTYAWPSVIVLAAGVAGFVAVTWRSRQGWRSAAFATGVVLVLCWLQPLVDQAVGGGNLATVLGPARDRPGAGLSAGVQIVAGAALVPPFWLPGSMRTFLLPYDGIRLVGAVAATSLWLSFAVVVCVVGARTGERAVRAVGAASVVGLVAALAAASAIPVSLFGLVPQNYYWMWSVAAFVSIAPVAALVSLPAVIASTRRGRPMQRRGALVAGLAVVGALAVWPRYPVAATAYDEVEARRVGRPLRAQLAAAIDAGLLDDHVEVDLSRAFFANDYPYVMLAELQSAGIEFHFVPESRNLERFGESRCAESGRYQRLVLISGPEPALAADSVVVAEVAGISAAELAEYERLQQRFGNLLRSGAIEIDGDALRAGAEPAPLEELRAVLEAPGLPATGLARPLDRWRRSQFITVPAAERNAFDRWFELEQRSSADYQTIVVEKPGEPTGAEC